MKVYINREAFEYIERKGLKGVTTQELADKLGIKERSAAAWLSKWAAKGYLEHVSYSGLPIKMKRGKRGRPRGSAGHYKIGRLWWGRLVFDSERIPWT